MKALGKMVPWLLTGLFLLAILWLTDFTLISFKDIKLVLILILATASLLLLHKDLTQSYKRYPLYLFMVAFLSTLTLFYQGVREGLESNLGVVDSFKPILYASLLYLPGRILLKVGPHKKWTDLLTPREEEILHHIRTGSSNKEIATSLYISETTVKKHVQNIMKKAGHSDRDRL